VLVLALCACAGTSEPDLGPLPEIDAVLLAPLGVTQKRALEPGAEVLDELITRVLWERDLRVQAPPADQIRADWNAATRDAAQAEPAATGDADAARFDRAAAALVAAFRARGTEFDALLIPALVIRQGKVVGQSVQWDGVVRNLPLEYENRDKAHIEARRRLETRCTSLRVLAYGADGKRLFERYGGLEVTQRMKIAEGNWSWTLRGDLFRKREDLESGVRVALRPLLRD
jgi:hypothetical protein